MAHVNILIHIVISTHRREMVIGSENADKLYMYITGIIKNEKCKMVIINGIPNHIHLLVDLHPSIALSTLMRVIKHSSSVWAKNSGYFPMFTGWSEGYFASSVSPTQKNSVIDYIKGQQSHHAKFRFDDEYDKLIIKNGMTLYRYPDENIE